MKKLICAALPLALGLAACSNEPEDALPPEDATAGDPMAGDPMANDPMANDAMADDATAGDPAARDATAPDIRSSEPIGERARSPDERAEDTDRTGYPGETRAQEVEGDRMEGKRQPAN